MYYDKLKLIINEWDPMGIIFEHANNYDEYESEIKKILDYIISEKNVTIDKLAKKIQDIFEYAFYKCDRLGYDKCYSIAKQILEASEKGS